MSVLMVVIFLFSRASILSVSARFLTCSPSNFTCPGSVVSCECQEARLIVIWTVTSSESELLDVTYRISSVVGVPTSPRDGYTVVLCDVDRSVVPTTLTSRLNFTFTEDVNVTCQENLVTNTITFKTAG